MVITCRLGKGNFRMLVVNTDGRLIRRLDAGTKRFDDVTISPDGQTVLYWASESATGDGGSLYTLPLVDVYVMNADGSGQRAVAETKSSDVKPVWSPDGKNLVIVSNRKSAFGKPGKTWDLWLTRVSDGVVLNNFKLDAVEITTPTWSYR